MITKTTSRVPSTPSQAPSPASIPPRPDAQTYEVRKGDSLSKILISANPGISGKDLKGLVAQTARMNGLADPDKIAVGQKLQLPAFEGARAAAAGAPAESRFSAAGPKPFGEAATGPKEADRARSAAEALLKGKPPQSTLDREMPLGAKKQESPEARPAAAGGAAGTAAAKGSKAGGEIRLDVPFYSQVPGGPQGPGHAQHGTACFQTAKAMAKAAGAEVLGPQHRIQVGLSEDSKGRLSVDQAKAAEGRAYVDAQLEKGKPVVVGVSHKDASYNADKLTDHFVTITGRGVDEQGRSYYTFNDPATRSEEKAKGRFYVDEQTGNLYKPGKEAKGFVVDRHFEVAMVRKNAE
jgi:LysM repeat protein